MVNTLVIPTLTGLCYFPTPSNIQYSYDLAYSATTVHHVPEFSAKPTFTFVPKNKKEVNTIAEWIKAFNCFMAVYSRRWPEEVPGLLKHMEVVVGLSDDNANWRL